MVLNRNTHKPDFILTLYLDLNSRNRSAKTVEKLAVKRKLKLFCLAVDVSKKQIKHLKTVCATADISACFIGHNLSKTVFSCCDKVYLDAKNKHKVDFVVMYKSKLHGYLLKESNTKKHEDYLAKALDIVSNYSQKNPFFGKI
jgi:hypothetical protein